MNLPTHVNALTFAFPEIAYKRFPTIKPIQEKMRGVFVDFLKRKASYKNIHFLNTTLTKYTKKI